MLTLRPEVTTNAGGDHVLDGKRSETAGMASITLRINNEEQICCQDDILQATRDGWFRTDKCIVGNVGTSGLFHAAEPSDRT